MSNRVAVFCRTHTWDAFVAKQAAQMRELSRGGHFYVLADETRAQLPVDGFYKFSHCDTDFEPLGLERYFNTNLLWYNGDYPLYKIVHDLPQYDYYVVLEFDVLTNVDLVGMADAAAAAGIDAAAYNIHPVEPEWPWLDSCRGIYDRPFRGLIPMLVLSRIAIEYLFDRRRRLTQRFRAKDIDRMPYCEAFVPTELMQSGFLKVADISTFGRTDRFEFWPPMLEGTVQLGAAPAFVHPVLDEARFIPNRLRHEANPASFLDPASRLRQDMAACRPEVAGPYLLEAIRGQGDAAAEAQLRQMIPALANL